MTRKNVSDTWFRYARFAARLEIKMELKKFGVEGLSLASGVDIHKLLDGDLYPIESIANDIAKALDVKSTRWFFGSLALHGKQGELEDELFLKYDTKFRGKNLPAPCPCCGR